MSRGNVSIPRLVSVKMDRTNLLLRFLAFLFVLAGFSGSARATHIVGGDITYQYIGNDNYRVVLYLYVDCFNGSPDAIESDQWSRIGVFNSSGTLVESLGLTRTGPTRIEGKSYSCVIPPSNQCVDLYIYQTQVNLPPTTGGYSLVFQRCCRNHSIANIIDPGATGTTYRTFIPTPALAMNNNSARFIGTPPNFLCKDEPLVYDHSASDTDGDSLVYELIAPLNGASSVDPSPTPDNFTAQIPINWRNPYNKNVQIGSNPIMSIDPETGVFRVTPTVTGQYVVGIAVHEFRNGKKINTVFRDFQFNIYDCNFTVKSAFAPINAYCSDNVSFTNSSSGNPVRYKWDFGIAGIEDDTSNAGTPSFKFPGPGKYEVKMSAYSSAGCANTSTRIVHILDDIVPGVIGDSFVCYGGQVNLSTTTSEPDISYLWMPSAGLDDPNIPNPTATVTADRTYTVRRSSVSCYVEEDVDVKVNTIDADFVHEYLPPCDGLRVKFFAKGNNYQILGWDFGDPNTVFDKSSDSATNWFYTDSGVVYVTMRVANEHCTDSFTKPIHIYFPDIFTAVIDTSICLGDKIVIGPLNDTSILDFKWSSSQYLSSDQVLYPVVDAPVSVSYVLVKTYKNCFTRDSFNVVVNELPDLGITRSKPGLVCIGDGVYLETKGDYKFEWFPKTGLQTPHQAGTWAYPDETTLYTVVATTDKGCTDEDTVRVEMYPSWELDLAPNYVACLGEVYLPQEDIPDAEYQWRELGMDVIIDSIRKEGTYILNVRTQCQSLYDTLSFFYYTESYCMVDFPNAFSPNGDGINDTYPYGGDFKDIFGTECQFDEYRLIIFNRWGQIVFRTEDSTAEWDGTHNGNNGTIDVYGYYLTYREYDWCKGGYVIRVKRGNITALH